MKKQFTEALGIVKNYNMCMHGKLMSKPTIGEFRESLTIVLEHLEHEQFTEKDLVDFGNYLLSFKRKETIKKEVNKRKVHDCDIANFKDRK